MKKLSALHLLCLASILVFAPVPGHAVYIDGSWYAHLSNVTWMYGIPFEGVELSSPNISALSQPGIVRLDVLASTYQATVGEAAGVVNGGLDPQTRVGPLSFDWVTNWSQPNLRLEIWAEWLASPDPSFMAWSTALVGENSGHVYIDENPGAWGIQLIIVPETTSLMSLVAGMVTLGLCASRRKMAK